MQDDCILVDNRLAVPLQLRPEVLKRTLREHPGQEAMLGVSRYMWWPHVRKDIVKIAEECVVAPYDKNAKYLIPKTASKSLPLRTQPAQDLQLENASTIENHNRIKIHLLVAIDRFSKFSSVKDTSGKTPVKFLRTYFDIHGIPESI